MPIRPKLLALSLTLLAGIALLAWSYMPIYPDEIAFRIQLGRYIQDGGVVHGLYALCTSNVKETPLIFIVPAWFVSWVDLNFSPASIRVFPFVAIIGTVTIAIRFAARAVTPAAAVVATTAFLGVAGSGLVMARYEYVHEIAILCCLVGFYGLNSFAKKPLLRYGVLALLLLSSLFSIYSHIQGLLFLPLSFYIAYLIVSPSLGCYRTGFLMIILLGFLAVTCINFHHSTCGEYPDIEEFWGAMTYSYRELESANIVDWFGVKFDKYYRSFLYSDAYAVNYLPGLNFAGSWLQCVVRVVNLCIRFLLTANCILIALTCIGFPLLGFLRNRLFRKTVAPRFAFSMSHESVCFSVLLASPACFLFLYDSSQNFYRSFFINYISAIALAILISQIRVSSSAKVLSWVYFGLCWILVITSAVFNLSFFTNRLVLQPGYEGPSLSLSRDWVAIKANVMTLADECGMNLSDGRILLDDMTFDSLKSYPVIYPISYVLLQANLAKMSMAETISRLHPNYALARCSALQAGMIDIEHQNGELCCASFSSVGMGK